MFDVALSSAGATIALATLFDEIIHQKISLMGKYFTFSEDLQNHSKFPTSRDFDEDN